MEVSAKEGWTIVHGLVVGTVFMVAFAGGVAGLWSLREELVTLEGIKERLRRLYLGVWGMAIIAWVTVVTGTYVVYPWYRAKPPEGTTDLTFYPRSFLLADPDKRVTRMYGVLNPLGWARRVTFVIDPQGIVRKVFPKVDVGVHSQEVLDFLKAASATGTP